MPPTRSTPPLLRSLDLFSGIGGLTLALHDAAAPVAYCDASPHARAVLRANMAAGRLPRAPVCEDVREMGARWLATHASQAGGAAVDLVVAGFPCTGMSVAGHRAGFAHDETALFYELLRVVDEVRPRALFLENSSNLLHVAMRDVAEQLTARGFELRYTLLSACDVGAPHRRRRWFCLAVRPDSAAVATRLATALGRAPTVPEYDWRPSREPPRMDRVPAGARTARFVVLGMAVVPAAARHAARDLAKRWVRRASATTSADEGATTALDSGAAYPPAAHVLPGPPLRSRRFRVVPEPLDPGIPGARPDLKLVLDPSVYKPRSAPRLRVLTSGLVTRPIPKDMWATPTRTYSATGYLTGRNHQCLMSQVRFERGTRDRGGYLSPGFVEWLMGYEAGWTAALADGVAPRMNRRF